LAKHSMICHPDTPAGDVEAFSVEVEREMPDRVWIRYHVDAPLDSLELGAPSEPDRADRLWQTTCFEAFVRHPGAESYCEFNFATSSQWAAYRFDRYREGMAELPMASLPETGNDASETHFALEATFALPPELAHADIEVAVTAVIEKVDGNKSYWALRHPSGQPDFHHPDCFTLNLPAPARP
jgi:hypothetical protein